MRASKAKKIRKECRIFLADMMAQKLSVRLKIAWQIIKGMPKKGKG